MGAAENSSTLRVTPQITEVKTEYCVTLAQRDAQIAENLRRIPGRIEYRGDTDEPIAVVAFGPSLLDTWEEIRKFKKIITCSGALPFLVQRGIIPTWHIEVDPRPHKATLFGVPHPDVEYYLASCTNPVVFDLLDQYNCKKVKLWHIFADEQFRPDQSYPFPKGEWMFTGGSNAGMRAMVLGRFFGHWNQTVFGLDSSFTPDRKQHAGFHPKEFDHLLVVPTKYGSYYTNASMYQAVKAFKHEISQIPNLNLTLRGDGLIQATMREYAETGAEMFHTKRTMMAMRYEKTLSDAYLIQNKKLHEINPAYGTSGVKYAEAVKKLKEELKAESVLDYGCGKSTLAQALPFPIWEYDPAIPGKTDNPKPADLLVCTDVLEHIEPEYLDAVMKDLQRCTIKCAYLVVSNVPAMKTLPDGRNTHLIVQNVDWWRVKISEYFDISKTVQGGVIEGKSTLVKFTCLPRKETSPLGVQLDKDPKQMWVPDAALPKDIKTVEEAKGLVPPSGQPLPGDQLPLAAVEMQGTEAKFLNINAMTEWRIKTFFTKEPATIQWIEQMDREDVFWDIGANMGGYAVWAAKRRDMTVFAFEPESGNYALLTRNFVINNVSGEAYCLALTKENKVGRLFTSNSDVGGSCHSFDQQIGPDLAPREGVPQGCIGFTLDGLVNAGLPSPNYIKIDVDGLEHEVIAGALTTLQSPALKGLCIEVSPNLEQHKRMIVILQEAGFSYDPEQVMAAARKDGPFKGYAEHIFTRRPVAAPAVVTPTVFDPDDVLQHVIKRIEQAEVIKRPFPHLYVQGMFPPDIYKMMMADMPSDRYYKTIEEIRGTKGYPDRFVCFELPRVYAKMIQRFTNGMLRKAFNTKFGVMGEHDESILIRDHPGYAIGPHTDSPKKVLSALFYLPKDDTQMNAGTMLYLPKTAGFSCAGGPHYPFEDFLPVDHMPFAPNSMFAFPKSAVSFHGVPVYEGPGARNVLLYDIQI